MPFPALSFDLVYCVHAVHHFPGPQTFVAEARRLLRPGGVLTIVGMDPHASRDHWYLYDYFDGTLAADLARFPSPGDLLDWAVGAGFARAEWRVVDTWRHCFRGQIPDFSVEVCFSALVAWLPAGD